MVLIILSTISINAVFSDTGIIKQAQRAKDMAANSIRYEQEKIKQLEEEFSNAMAGGSDAEGGGKLVTNITLNKTAATMTIGENLTLTAIITPEDASNKSVTWNSSNTSVATVNNGTVAAKAVGSTIITVTAQDGSGKTATCNITVTVPTGPNGKPLVTELEKIQTETVTAEDSKGNQVVVPSGFKVRTDLGDTVQDGIVIEDDIGNQFVWIPVSNINKDGSNKIIKDDESEVEITLGRYTFDTTTGEETVQQLASNYTQIVAIQNNFQELSDARESNGKKDATGTNTTAKDLKGFIESAQKNKGYYLARYEASFGSGTASGTITDQKPYSKESTSYSSTMKYTAGTLWNNITQADAAKLCRNMYDGNSYIQSDLTNSYAWDTAICYIQAMGHSNYANEGVSTTGNTGKTGDEKCHIYDMSANLYEWTTEFYANGGSGNSSAYPCTCRGDLYDYSGHRTSGRDLSATTTRSSVGFRPICYVNN